ncbi:g1740 [Coccomyxa elongata]
MSSSLASLEDVDVEDVKEGVHQRISPATEETLQEIFHDIDRDHNGKLEVVELKEALNRLGLPGDSHAYISDLLKQYDRNHDGSIDWEEYRRYVVRKERIIRRTFQKLDEDGSGSISADELTKALRKLWMSVSSEDAERMVGLLDADHNGQISLDEFRRFVYLLPESLVTPTNIVYALVDSSDWIEGVELRLCMTPPKQPFQRLLAGGIAGMASRAAVAPFERMRTMYMADRTQTSMAGCAHNMWKDGGVRGLFKGNLATILKVAPQTAIQFAVYDTITDAMLRSMASVESASGIHPSKQLSRWQHLLAGCAAGAAATVVTYPMETLRTHMALGGQSYRQCLADVLQAHGHRGLYKGFTSGVMSSAVSNGLGFASYETGLSFYRHFSAGASPAPAERGIIAGVAATIVMAAIQPLEVIMRRMQVQGKEGFPVKYANVWHCAYRIVAEEGMASFWRGSLCSFAKVAPSIAAVRFTYEALIQSWGVGGLRKYRVHEPENPSDLPPLV